MAIAQTLFFHKQANGNVWLIDMGIGDVVASFSPAQNLVCDNNDPNRFFITPSTGEDSFLIDYRSILQNNCSPQFSVSNRAGMITALSEFFFLSSNNSKRLPPPFGVFEWVARGSDHGLNNPIAGDLFQGFISPTEFSNTLIWNGIGATDNSNLANFQILNSTQL
jgi:hypothetical protein